MGLSENLRRKKELPRQEMSEQELYEIGVRIPVFKIKEAEVKAQSRIITYEAQFTLETHTLPNLPFSVSLGHPIIGGHINLLNNSKKLRVEGDLSSLENAELAKKTARSHGFAFGPFEPYSYTFTDETRRTLTSLRFRVYDGEDGKVYEGVPSERELLYGRLVFEDEFFEVLLDNHGKVIWQADKKTALAYTLDGTTGGEDTEGEFILQNDNPLSST
jgi:hypothetical protein